MTGGGRGELSPLADRLGLLQVLRVALGATVLAAAASSPHVVGLDLGRVAPLTAAYALITVAAEVGRRLAGTRGLAIVTIALLIDGVYLAVLTAPSGGPRSPLAFLIFLHLVGVTLLVSYRSGLKLALWHSLLMIVGYQTVQSGWTEILFHLPRDHAVTVPDGRQVLLAAAACLLLAGATAACARLSEQELRRGEAELAALVAMGAELEQARRPDEVGDVLRRHVQAGFGFPRVVVLGPAAASDSSVARAVELRDPIRLRHLDPEADQMLTDALPSARNIVLVPLIADREVQGVLAVERAGSVVARIPRSTINALTSFGTHAALALRNAWLLAEVERLATMDGLTGVANRRTFEAALHREVAWAGRTSQPLSLILVDIDHFKAINDTLGHQGGDEVLRHVGAALASHAREVDLAARYGGEEFCVLLPACPPDDALAVADRLRAAIAEFDGPIAVTASAGVATLPLDAADDRTLVAAADKALYRAKETGRDRTVSASPRRRAKLTV